MQLGDEFSLALSVFSFFTPLCLAFLSSSLVYFIPFVPTNFQQPLSRYDNTFKPLKSNHTNINTTTQGAMQQKKGTRIDFLRLTIHPNYLPYITHIILSTENLLFRPGKRDVRAQGTQISAHIIYHYSHIFYLSSPIFHSKEPHSPP